MSKPLTQPGTLPLLVATCEPWGTRSNMGYLGKVCAQRRTPTKFLINSQKYMQSLNYQICDAFLSAAPFNDFPGQRTQLNISWEFPLLPCFSTDFACSAVLWVVRQLIGQSIHWDQLNSVHKIKWRLCDSSSETQAVWAGVLCLCAELQCAYVKGSLTTWTSFVMFLWHVAPRLQCCRRNCSSVWTFYKEPWLYITSLLPLQSFEIDFIPGSKFDVSTT